MVKKLKNAIRTISSFPECKQVFELDKQFKYFQNFWNKFAHFAVSFDEMHQTMAIFGENKKTLMGRNILSRMIKMAATEEDFDVLSGLIKRCKKGLNLFSGATPEKLEKICEELEKC